MPKFRSRPNEVEAIRLGDLLGSLSDGLDTLKWWGVELRVSPGGVMVCVEEVWSDRFELRDWLVRGRGNHVEVVKDAEFQARYEEAK